MPPTSSVMWWKLSCFVSGLCMEALRKAALAALTCSFVLCGSLIGTVSGAMKGQTTETGLFRGAAIGLVAGALVSVEILESCLQGELLSKLDVFDSLLNGKVFPEWVSPAMLKAYQWQINSIEAISTESSDIFEVPCNDGLLPSKIKMLPEFKISRENSKDFCRKKLSCAVCLQEFTYGESARRLPTCGHVFHTACIDMWLLRHGSCPVCRHDVHCSARLLPSSSRLGCLVTDDGESTYTKRGVAACSSSY